MRSSYVYQKRVRPHRYLIYRHRLGLVLLVLLGVGLIVAAIAFDLRHSNKKKLMTSQAQSQSITGNLQTFRSAYFQFKDTGKWVLNSKESTADKYIYYKYRGLVVEHSLIVYVNQVPISLYLASSRVLPVRIVNNDSLDVTSVSGPCGNSYGPQDLHRIKDIVINGAIMQCDPDTPQYTVVLGEINGSYQLHMQRLSGGSVQFVITYRDLRLNTGQDTILQIAHSFQAL